MKLIKNTFFGKKKKKDKEPLLEQTVLVRQEMGQGLMM